jgi:hypothetical protein
VLRALIPDLIVMAQKTHGTSGIDSWASERQWMQAWQRAEVNRTRFSGNVALDDPPATGALPARSIPEPSMDIGLTQALAGLSVATATQIVDALSPDIRAALLTTVTGIGRKEEIAEPGLPSEQLPPSDESRAHRSAARRTGAPPDSLSQLGPQPGPGHDTERGEK